jgi:hypothetical protein
MRPDGTDDALAALLEVLERAEGRPLEEAPMTLRQWSEPRPEAKPHVPIPKPADQSGNRLVERIASAMLKLRVQGA